MKKTIIALALLGSSAAFAQSATYSTATFNWQKTVGTAVTSQATQNIVLTQGVDGTLSATGGVTFSAGSGQTVYSATDARNAYATFANSVYGLVKTNVTAVGDAVAAYNNLSSATRTTNINAESLTLGGTNTLLATNDPILYGARNAVKTAIGTLHTNIGTANSALSDARSAISTERVIVSGVPEWEATKATLVNGFYQVIQADGSSRYYRIFNSAPVENHDVTATYKVIGENTLASQFKVTESNFVANATTAQGFVAPVGYLAKP